MSGQGDAAVRLSVRSMPSHLRVVRSAVEEMCRLVGFDESSVTRIVLSVDEAMTNIIRHAYGGREDQPIEIEMSPLGASAPEGLRICLRDHGRQVDYSRIRSRDLKDVRPGGLGVHIMTECMDRLEYQPAEGGGTLLTMVKNLAGGEADES